MIVELKPGDRSLIESLAALARLGTGGTGEPLTFSEEMRQQVLDLEKRAGVAPVLDAQKLVRLGGVLAKFTDPRLIVNDTYDQAISELASIFGWAVP